MDPLKIHVLGPGCPKCDLVARRVREALAASGQAASVEKVADIDRMLSFGITATPAVVVDGRVRSSGRIPRVGEIEAWIGETANPGAGRHLHRARARLGPHWPDVRRRGLVLEVPRRRRLPRHGPSAPRAVHVELPRPERPDGEDEGNVLYGGVLLFVYALGHSALVLIAGTSVGAAKGLLESKGLRRAHGIPQKAAGVLIIAVGIYFLFGR